MPDVLYYRQAFSNYCDFLLPHIKYIKLIGKIIFSHLTTCMSFTANILLHVLLNRYQLSLIQHLIQLNILI